MSWNIEGKVVLITGATGGIGLEAAIALARQGARPIIVGRGPDRTRAAVAQIRNSSGIEAP